LNEKCNWPFPSRDYTYCVFSGEVKIGKTREEKENFKMNRDISEVVVRVDPMQTYPFQNLPDFK
jgi:hypothetical protein